MTSVKHGQADFTLPRDLLTFDHGHPSRVGGGHRRSRDALRHGGNMAERQ